MLARLRRAADRRRADAELRVSEVRWVAPERGRSLHDAPVDAAAGRARPRAARRAVHRVAARDGRGSRRVGSRRVAPATRTRSALDGHIVEPRRARAERASRGRRSGRSRRCSSRRRYLHDIGYAPELVDSGFHPLDGARWLHERKDLSASPAWSRTTPVRAFEAEARGLGDGDGGVSPTSARPSRDALAYSDLTTGPAGQAVTVAERLAEIERRYGSESVVVRALEEASTRCLTRWWSAPSSASQRAADRAVGADVRDVS